MADDPCVLHLTLLTAKRHHTVLIRSRRSALLLIRYLLSLGPDAMPLNFRTGETHIVSQGVHEHKGFLASSTRTVESLQLSTYVLLISMLHIISATIRYHLAIAIGKEITAACAISNSLLLRLVDVAATMLSIRGIHTCHPCTYSYHLNLK